MIDLEEKMRAVAALYESLQPKEQEIVTFYAEQIREQLDLYDALNRVNHAVYLGIALDIVATALFSEMDKPK